MSTVITLFIVAGATIVLGFLASLIFRKTRVPDLILMILLGILLGPVLGVFEPKYLLQVAPAMATIALVVILFDAGLNLELRRVLRQAPRAIALSVTSFTLSTALIAVASAIVLGLRWSRALLLGCILGGTSAVTIIPLMKDLRAERSLQTVLSLDATLTDAFTAISSLATIEVIKTGVLSWPTIFQLLVTGVSVALILGLILGLFWLAIFLAVRKEPYRYAFTIAFALLTYAASEMLGGSGALSVLTLGLVFGNRRDFLEALGQTREAKLGIDGLMRRFHAELSFLVRTYFFLFLGLLASFKDIPAIIFGVVLSILLLLPRHAAAWLATLGNRRLAKYRSLIGMTVPRGLAAAVMAAFAAAQGIGGTEPILPVTLAVILGTNAIYAGAIASERTLGVHRSSR